MRFHFLWRLAACVTWWLASGCALASTLGSLRFDHLGPDQGFVQQSIIAIAQDQQGYMWFGTQAGLVKYDGYRTTLFRSDPKDPETLRDNYASALYVHQDGNLWIGTQSGLAFYQHSSGKFRNFLRDAQHGAIQGNYKIQAIVSDGKSGLWLGTDYGLMHFDMRSHQFVDYRSDHSVINSLRDNLITDLVVDRQHRLWIATPSGLDHFDPSTQQFKHIDLNIKQGNAIAQNNIVALSLDRQQRLWVASEGGLFSLDTLQENFSTIRSEAEQEGLDVARLQTLFHDQDGILWIGTVNQGLLKYDPRLSHNAYELFRHRPLDPNSLLHNHVSKIFQDRTGVLWVGARSAGLSRIDLKSGGFHRYVQLQDDASGNSDNRIRAIASADKDSLWLGTYAGGLLKMNLRNHQIQAWSKTVNANQGLAGNQISAIHPDPEGRLWILTHSGLSLFSPAKNHFQAIHVSKDANDNYLERILFDKMGNMWLTSRGGVHRRLKGQDHFTSFRHDPQNPDSIANNWAYGLLETRSGELWIGTMNGLDRFDPQSEKFSHFVHSEADKTSLSHNRIHALYEDSKGNIWVGTSGGLNLMRRTDAGNISFRFFATQTDGSAESVGGILEDKAGHIWISSTAGISKIDTTTFQVKNYSDKDGMIQGSYLIGAAHKAQDGSLFFGGWTGLSQFKPEEIQDNMIPPKVVINDVLISNQSISKLSIDDQPRLSGAVHDAKTIFLNHRDTNFVIEFAALHYADPSRNRYAYQLEGFDPGWIETDAQKRFATYTNLDPARYVFKVKASNKNGLWSEATTTLIIDIAPPFWRSWWFRLSLAFAIIGLTYSFFRYRMRNLIQQKRTLEEQVFTRTQELQSQKVSVELQKETVEEAHHHISLLSEIGKEITAKLDTEAIIDVLYRKVNELMDATVFGIGFYHREKNLIEFPFVVEAGKRYEFYTRDFSDKNQMPVWCIDHQQEILIGDLDHEYHHYIQDLSKTENPETWGAVLPGASTEVTPQSMLYMPIFVKGMIRGVISVQSYRLHAYRQTDLDIVRTLASYVGIALDNADAYQQLREAQAQLVEREKLAALGSLVAGVAHELNTPLGNSLLIASSIEDSIEKINVVIDSGQVRRSDFKQFSVRCREACELLMRSLKTSTNLVSSFKQVAVDQASAQARRFDLLQTTEEIAATIMNQVRQAGHHLVIDIPAKIELNSYPGSYGQVIINLIQNAMVHGFDGRRDGTMRISAQRLGHDKVQIIVEDNGKGIPEENINRIFEPFFTTKLGQGGSGLGLHITYNIVTSLLAGQISVESSIIQGTRFVLELALDAINDAPLPGLIDM